MTHPNSSRLKVPTDLTTLFTCLPIFFKLLNNFKMQPAKLQCLVPVPTAKALGRIIMYLPNS